MTVTLVTSLYDYEKDWMCAECLSSIPVLLKQCRECGSHHCFHCAVVHELRRHMGFDDTFELDVWPKRPQVAAVAGDE